MKRGYRNHIGYSAYLTGPGICLRASWKYFSTCLRSTVTLGSTPTCGAEINDGVSMFEKSVVVGLEFEDLSPEIQSSLGGGKDA